MIRESNGFSVVELMVAGAIIAIVLALAVPFYSAYKRGSCDRMAQQDLASLRSAVYNYINDPANKNHELPRNLGDLAGEYYGWGGTNNKCGVRVYYYPSSQSICAVAMKGSRPRGVSSRYRYCHRIRGLASNRLDSFPERLWSAITNLLAPAEAHAFIPDIESPPAEDAVEESNLNNYIAVNPYKGCQRSAFDKDGNYVGCSESTDTGQIGDYTFYTEFDNMDGLTPAYGSDNQSWSTEGGFLVGKRNKSGEQNIVFGSDKWKDYSVEVSGTLFKTNGKKGTQQSPGYGLYYRATDNDGNGKYTGYRFQYDAALGDKFVVRKVVDGKESAPFQSAKMKDFMDDEDIYNKNHTVNVAVKGEHHTIKVDGVTVLEFDDDTFSQGKSGLRTWANNGNWSQSLAKFDWVKVRTIGGGMITKIGIAR